MHSKSIKYVLLALAASGFASLAQAGIDRRHRGVRRQPLGCWQRLHRNGWHHSRTALLCGPVQQRERLGAGPRARPRPGAAYAQPGGRYRLRSRQRAVGYNALQQRGPGGSTEPDNAVRRLRIREARTRMPSTPSGSARTIWVLSLEALQPLRFRRILVLIIGNIDGAIDTLAGMGAKNFLVVTVPDLGKTPDVTALGPAGRGRGIRAFGGFRHRW